MKKVHWMLTSMIINMPLKVRLETTTILLCFGACLCMCMETVGRRKGRGRDGGREGGRERRDGGGMEEVCCDVCLFCR